MAVIRYGPRPETIEYPRGKTLYRSSGWLSDVRVSPSGNEVAFIDHLVLGDDGGNIMAVDGKGARRMLSSGWASAKGWLGALGPRSLVYRRAVGTNPRALRGRSFRQSTR